MTDSSFSLIDLANGNRIPVTGSMVIGRSADCDLQVQQGLLSRRHAQLHLQPDGAWLEDLKSANGTFVNGVRIEAQTRLTAGDRVRFDVAEFEFQTAASSAAAADGATLYRKPDPPVVRAPPAPPAIAESGVYKRPPAWVDQQTPADGENKTKLIDPELLKSMRAAAPVNVRTDEIRLPCLIVQSGGQTNRKIELHAAAGGAQEWSIGSHADREILLEDPGVSTLHAKIVNEGNRWKVIDQMSANGTFVNDRRSNASFLSAGDRLRFGPVECVFQVPGGSARSQAATEIGTSSPNKVLLIGAALALAAIVAFSVIKFI
jgi:pSer/pThr/pTyr-binding forkhead associated (FHA) protein